MQEFRLLHLIQEHPVEVFLVAGIVLVIALVPVSHWMFKFVEASGGKSRTTTQGGGK
jgi:hypothetical protein